VTTALQYTREDGRGKRWPALPAALRPGDQAPRHGSWFARDPAWPIVALLAGWPLWWALGIGPYMPVILAIPMLNRMHRWKVNGSRTLRFPPGAALWVLFLIVQVASIATINLTAPDTVASPVSARVLSWAVRTLSYAAAGVLLLYAGNLTERELPRRRLAWLLGLVGIYTVIGGVAGVVLPSFQFTSPLALLVPQSVQSSASQLGPILHPATAQVQTFIGHAEGRPSAPFSYTNMWGNCLAILLPWLIVVWWAYGTRRQRRAVVAVLAIAFVPAVYSLDRGLWIGLAVALCYVAVRFAARGKLAILGVICFALVLGTVLILATPLQDLITGRFANPVSNTGRASDTLISVRDAESSAVLGYGDSRHAQGSASSITLGKTANCKACGQSVVGGDGQLQLLLVSSGFVGAGLYVAFFGYGIWRYRRDKTPYGMAGVLVLLLGFIFMFVYEAVGAPLAFTMLSYALLWRNETDLQRGARPPKDRARVLFRHAQSGTPALPGHTRMNAGVTSSWRG
jgi:hypothetical protein